MRVLIVDDEPNALREVEIYVKMHSKVKECTVCSNPLKALELCEAINFDVALLDIEMPVMSGLDLAEKMIQIRPRISIAFITAYNNFAAEAFEVNAVDYILKPIREERLGATLDKLYGKLSANAELIDRPKLYIQAFKKLEIKADGNLLKWNRQKSAEIFAYLLMNKGEWVNKERLCDDIWPDYEPRKALAYLQTAMCQIRKTLSVFSEEQIKVEFFNNSYRLIINSASYYDVDAYVELSRKASEIKDKTTEYIERLILMYKGKFLEEEGWIWSIAYSETLDLKNRYLLNRLIDFYAEQKNWDSLLRCMDVLIQRRYYGEEILEKYTSLFNLVFGREKTKVLIEALKEMD